MRERRGANIAAVALANRNARVLWALLATQRGLPRPGCRLSGAPEKNLPKELRRLSAKLMANRSDRHLSNLSNSQGTKPARLIRRRCADFHHGPECNAALHQRPHT